MAAVVEDLDFNAPEFLRDPWPILKALRDTEPVFWSRSHQAWVVTRHADVLAAFRDKRLTASRIVPFLETVPGGLGDDFPLIRRFENAWITNVDDPTHSRLRRLMIGAFSKPVVESLRPKARLLSQALLESVDGREIDFTIDVARELPSRVVTELLGVPPELRQQFSHWAAAIQQATGAAVLTRAMIEQYHQTLVDMNVELARLIEARRRVPQDDLLTAFVRARDSGDQLSEDEMLGACHATVIGAFETTMHMLTLGLIELVERPWLQRRMLEGPAECQRVVDELLRYVGMVKGMLRIVREPFEWHGKQLRTGDLVFGMNMSASHDERVFAEPEVLDPARNNALSAAFGPGAHHCLGHFLARMELGEFFTQAFASYDVEVLERERRHINSFAFRGLEGLKVRFTRRAGAPGR